MDVVDPVVHLAEHADVAEDPRQPPLVLVLEVGPRAELVDPHHHHVLALVHEIGDVELVGEPGAHRLAGPPPVHPHPEGGLNTLEAQQHSAQSFGLALVREVAQVEGGPVVGGGVGVRHVRWVYGEGVDDVGVPRGAKSAVAVEVLEHPVPGHGDLLRPVGVQCRRVGALLESLCCGGEPAEVPCAGQGELQPVGVQVRPWGKRPTGSVDTGEPPGVGSQIGGTAGGAGMHGSGRSGWDEVSGGVVRGDGALQVSRAGGCRWQCRRGGRGLGSG